MSDLVPAILVSGCQMVVRVWNIPCAFEQEVVHDCFLGHSIDDIAGPRVHWRKIDFDFAGGVEIEAGIWGSNRLLIFELTKLPGPGGVVGGVGDVGTASADMERALPVLFVVDFLVLSTIVGDIFGRDPGSAAHWGIETIEVPCHLALIAEDHGTWVRIASKQALVTVRHSSWILDQLAGVDNIRNCGIAHRAEEIVSIEHGKE